MSARTTSFGLGVALLAVLWMGPLPELSGHSFSAHMTLHMGVVAVAAPLLALGVMRGCHDPVFRVPWLFAAIPASIVELLVVWAWHAPALHHWARHQHGGLALEQGMFLASGLLVWLSALGGPASGARLGAGIIALLLTSMHMTLLGALLALAPRPLYGHEPGIAGLTALEDQQLGGAIMLLVGGISYLAGGLGLTVALVRWRSPAPPGLRKPGAWIASGAWASSKTSGGNAR